MHTYNNYNWTATFGLYVGRSEGSYVASCYVCAWLWLLNIPQQQIFAKSKGVGVIFEGGVSLHKYGDSHLHIYGRYQ